MEITAEYGMYTLKFTNDRQGLPVKVEAKRKRGRTPKPKDFAPMQDHCEVPDCVETEDLAIVVWRDVQNVEYKRLRCVDHLPRNDTLAVTS